MPTLTVARGTVKARGKVYSQGQSVRLALRDIDSIREVLAPPKRYHKNNRNGQIRREHQPKESLWRCPVSRMYFLKIFSLRLLMTKQMDFWMRDIARIPMEELIRMVVKRRGYREWPTAPSSK